MDRVADWLIRNGLGRYASKFEECGWDDKSLLYKMTENDIELCIQKPGHKVKFKTALVREMVHPSVATQTDKDMECVHEAVHTKLAEQIAARIAVDHNISDLINVAVEKAIKGIIDDSDKTVTDTIKFESDKRKSNTVACSTVNESDVIDMENFRLKADKDETCAEKVTIRPDNVKESKGIEKVLEPTINTISGDSIVAAEEIQGRHLTESRDLEAGSSNSAVDSKVGHENLCEADIESEAQYKGQSEGQSDGQSEGQSEEQSEEQSEGESEEQFEGQSEGQYEREDILEDCDQESYCHDLSPICKTKTAKKDLVVVSYVKGRNGQEMARSELTSHSKKISAETSPLSAAIGSQPVNFYQTIIKHSENTSIVEGSRDTGDKRWGTLPDAAENLHGQMSVIADSYEKKDELFVETKAYMELKSVVEDRHWATLLGKPGDGKSTTATHLMLHYKRQGYQPLFVTSVWQWEMLISSKPGDKQFVIIDDMFGAINLDDKITEEWINEIEKMDKIVSEKKGDLLVVCTSRKYIFTDVKSKIHKCQRFSDVSIVDMTDNEYQLSGDEKVSILVKYANRYNIKLGAKLVRQIKDVQSPHGFPHCVEMFCTNAFHRKIGAKFFSNPEKAVQKEINNFKDNDPMKFLVLLLVMYHKNRFEKRHIGEMIASSDKDVQKLFSFLSIVQSTAYLGLLKAAKALTNTYLALTKDGYYTFTHESLAENVSKVYMELNSVHATQIMSFQEIMKHVKTPKENVDLPNYELAERITSELLMGNLKAVSSCASWRDKTFVDEWIKYITMQCKASCCWSSLSKITLKRILHIDIDSSASLITCLLYKGMEQAATAILSSKSIRKLLHTDQIWIKALEQLLKLVCRTIPDMDVVKAIVEPHETNNDNNKILDGSAAFVSAIETSDAECAQYIVENTKIMFGESNITSYFEGLEISSIGFANFIQLFDNHEQSSEIKTKLLAYVILHTSSVKCLQMLSLLIDNGANCQCMNEENFNALHIACKRNRKDLDFGVLKYLVDIGVDASQESSEGEVPLMLALQHNTKECIIKLLLPISPRKHKTKAGQGYFHYLMRSSCSFDILSASCKMLLNEGEDANLQDASGTTPVMYLMQTFLSKQWCQLSMYELRKFNLFSYSIQTYALRFMETQFQDLLTSISLNLHLSDNAGQNVLHHLLANRKYKYMMSLFWTGMCRVETTQGNYIREAYNLLVNKFNVDDQLKNKNGRTPNMFATQYWLNTKRKWWL